MEKLSDKKIEIEDLKKEDFIDLLPVILNKVIQTKSDEKRKRYRNILLHAIFEKDETEMIRKYVSLIETLNETQILILSTFLNSGRGVQSENDIAKCLTMPKGKMAHEFVLNRLSNSDIKLQNGVIITEGEFKFLLNELRSTGLFEGQKSGTFLSNTNQEVYTLSIAGKDFLKFIQEFD